MTRPVEHLSALTLFLLLVVGCGTDDESSAEPAEETIAVQAWTVVAVPLVTDRHWTGRLEPLRTLSLPAPSGGRVVSIQVSDGDYVEAGHLLIQLEGPDVDARRPVLLERVAQLEDELDRWRRLQSQGAAGAGEVSDAQLRLLEAREDLESLEATAGTFQLHAPASGPVYGVSVATGSQVTAGQLLLSVEDERSLGIRLSVPSHETRYFETPERLSVQDDRGNPLQIERTVLTSDLHPSFVRVELYLSGASEVEVARRSVTVRHRDDDEALLVPWTAVASDGDRHWVARVVEGDPDRVERRTVELGRPAEEGIEVRSGLEAGDRVIRYEPRSHPEGRAVAAVDSRDPS